MELIVFILLFLALFFVSRVMTERISFFFLRATGSSTLAIQILAILFLPGVIVHELAHWLFASILFVPTGEIEFLPQAKGNSVKLGSVQIAKTDPIRRLIIGIAPVLGGLGLLTALFWFLSPVPLSFTWKGLFFLYGVFEIGNTMFSSKKDLEGIVGALIFLFFFVALLFFLHVPVLAFFTSIAVLPMAFALIHACIVFFLLALGIDIGAIGIFSIFLRLLKK